MWDIAGDLFDCLRDGNLLATLASKLNNKSALRDNSKAKPGEHTRVLVQQVPLDCILESACLGNLSAVELISKFLSFAQPCVVPSSADLRPG